MISPECTVLKLYNICVGAFCLASTMNKCMIGITVTWRKWQCHCNFIEATKCDFCQITVIRNKHQVKCRVYNKYGPHLTFLNFGRKCGVNVSYGCLVVNQLLLTTLSCCCLTLTFQTSNYMFIYLMFRVMVCMSESRWITVIVDHRDSDYYKHTKHEYSLDCCQITKFVFVISG